MFPIVTWLAVGTMCCLLVKVDSLIPDIFFPFGPDAGDSVVPNDYNYGLDINISTYFCGIPRTNVMVHWRGDIYFYDQYYVDIFLTQLEPDVNSSHVYARNTTDPALLLRVSELVAAVNCCVLFQPQNLLIATWENMTYTGGNESTPRNSFQLVLATDSVKYTFVILNYGNLTFTGEEGLYHWPASADIDCRPSVPDLFSLPSSNTADVVNLGLTSNVGTPGRWIYRVDGSTRFDCRLCSDQPKAPRSNPRCRGFLYRAHRRTCGYRKLPWNRRRGHRKPKRG